VSYFKRHLVAFLLYTFSTATNRIKVGSTCVHILWLRQWRCNWNIHSHVKTTVLFLLWSENFKVYILPSNKSTSLRP